MWNYNYYIYITTNPGKTVLYVGVTNDLYTRLAQHKENRATQKLLPASTPVYYERFTHIDEAIAREKELKKWRREKKDKLIESNNPAWRFLNDEI